MPPEPLEPWRIVVQVFGVAAFFVISLLQRSDLLRITALCIGAMIFYGMVQDQFSVRLSPKYFTVAHAPIESLSDPTLLGITWGFLGSWWGGLFAGVAIALTATLGENPPLTLRQLLLPVGLLLAGTATGTILCGFAGHYNGKICAIVFQGGFGSTIPKEEQLWFFTVACAHMGTYTSSVIATIAVCIWVGWFRRQQGIGVRQQQELLRVGNEAEKMAVGESGSTHIQNLPLC
ncbi:MAG: hypothetical protein ACFCD0_01880 [Gemmataceae bacterium]